MSRRVFNVYLNCAAQLEFLLSLNPGRLNADRSLRKLNPGRLIADRSLSKLNPGPLIADRSLNKLIPGRLIADPDFYKFKPGRCTADRLQNSVMGVFIDALEDQDPLLSYVIAV